MGFEIYFFMKKERIVMVRDKIGSAKDAAETAIIEAEAKALVKTTNTVKKLSAKKWGRAVMTAAAMAMMAGAMAVTAFADDGNAEGVFSAIEGDIGKWVTRIGGLVVIFGGVNAGIGVANQDDSGRNRGFMTMAGGAILIAVVSALGLSTG